MTSIWPRVVVIARERSAASGRWETVLSTIGFSQSAKSPAGRSTAGRAAATRSASPARRRQHDARDEEADERHDDEERVGR